MLKKIKSFASAEEKKRIISNFFSLAMLQGANLVLPLLTLPYLVRVLGVESFGLLAFAAATIAYFQVITDYGFNLTATRQISVNRGDKLKVIEIFSSVMTIKILLMLVSLCLLSGLVFFFQKFSKYAYIYYLTFGMVIGQVLFPVWFFQGMERMQYITYINVGSKLIFTLLVFVFVKGKGDLYLVPLFNSLGAILGGMYALYFLYTKFGVRFRFQNIGVLKSYVYDGWYIFISRIAVVLYGSSNIFILGIFSNNTAVGYFSVAEKILAAFKGLIGVMLTVIFPFMSKVWSVSSEKYYILFKKIIKSLIVILVCLTVTLMLFSEFLVGLVAGEDVNEIHILLNILAIALLLSPLGGLFTQHFVSIGQGKYVTKATMWTTLVNSIIVFPLIIIFDFYGLALTIVFVQVFQVIINSKYYLKLVR